MTGDIKMIRNTFEESYSPAWLQANITNPVHELVILREVIPWQKIINRLCQFYNNTRGPYGISLRVMISILIVMRHNRLSDREVVKQVKENRYIQYFCNVSDKGLQTFLDPSSIVVFRQRLGEKGIAIIEKEVFEVLRRAGIIQGDNALIDSSVLSNNIIYPNDVHLIFKAFKKMKQFAKMHNIPVWWNEDEIKKLWREFRLAKDKDRMGWLVKFNLLFIPSLDIFNNKIKLLQTTKKRKLKAKKINRRLEVKWKLKI